MTTTETPAESPSPALARLARECGVSVEYFSWNGVNKQCSASAIRDALAAMGIDASTDEACDASLADLADLPWRRLVPPVTVLREGDERELPIHVRHGDPAAATLHLESGEVRELEQLDRVVEPRTIGSTTVGRATFEVPGDLPLGWHRVEASTTGRRGRGYVVVTPRRLEPPVSVRKDRPWGLFTQLYSVRSEQSWGLGDFADLADLCALGKMRGGADFMLVNPLHAGEPVTPIEPSPYLPTSRRFISPLYIRVEDIAEVAYLPSQRRALIEWEAERPRRVNNTDEPLDRDGVWRAKSAALEQVYAEPRSAGREAQFEAFCLHEGRALEDFATWCAIAEQHKGLPWPAELDNPASPAVAAWRDENVSRVLYYAWLQWVADEQLARAHDAALASGMSIGLMADLAVGVHPEGADAWALQRVLAQGIGVGAPPDMYNQLGQNWSQPPWQPRALEAAAYIPFRDLLRAAMRNVGALRIDHVLGLFRQWWVPAGHGAADGVYVRFDHDALVGILALEAHRAGVMVIGEDLGTVEPYVREVLADRGILGTAIVWFEQEPDGTPRAPENYRHDVLASVTTHDLPPTVAYLNGEHVELREELGLLEGDPDAARADAREERDRMIALLRERDWVIEDYNDEDLVAGLNILALNTPALLTGVALTDLVGERRTQNQPGTHREYPNWQIPLCDANGVPVLLDNLFDLPRAQRLLKAIAAARQ
ncbi:4-alpha-glucanotransferase [Demequina aurantiaca]|uniref:4-alpha-glucanotransferase n=1 Tax=Demequina aurantiaca TaxID=676200 RepID=UPI000A05DE2C|nr:4-alpha-glucanotransferase [Demequina aurantiaca]